MLVLIWEIQMTVIIQMTKTMVVRFNISDQLLGWIVSKYLKVVLSCFFKVVDLIYQLKVILMIMHLRKTRIMIGQEIGYFSVFVLNADTRFYCFLQPLFS